VSYPPTGQLRGEVSRSRVTASGHVWWVKSCSRSRVHGRRGIHGPCICRKMISLLLNTALAVVNSQQQWRHRRLRPISHTYISPFRARLASPPTRREFRHSHRQLLHRTQLHKSQVRRSGGGPGLVLMMINRLNSLLVPFFRFAPEPMLHTALTLLPPFCTTCILRIVRAQSPASAKHM
jgi:hypothetical protein